MGADCIWGDKRTLDAPVLVVSKARGGVYGLGFDPATIYGVI